MCLGIPGQIVELTSPDGELATVDIGGVRREVCLTLVSEGPDAVVPGDWVLIHVGFALSRLHEDEARETLELIAQMGEVYEQELEDLRASEG